jgi:hypothetical protein
VCRAGQHAALPRAGSRPPHRRPVSAGHHTRCIDSSNRTSRAEGSVRMRAGRIHTARLFCHTGMGRPSRTYSCSAAAAARSSGIVDSSPVSEQLVDHVPISHWCHWRGSAAIGRDRDALYFSGSAGGDKARTCEVAGVVDATEDGQRSGEVLFSRPATYRRRAWSSGTAWPPEQHARQPDSVPASDRNTRWTWSCRPVARRQGTNDRLASLVAKAKVARSRAKASSRASVSRPAAIVTRVEAGRALSNEVGRQTR